MTMEPKAYEKYSAQIQGLLFLGLIVGIVFAELFLSGHVSDWLVARLARRNNDRRAPEMRLWLGYPAAVVSSVGLIVWGFSIDREWHWMTGQVAFFLCKYSCCRWLPRLRLILPDAAGLQVGNMVVTAYIVDNYPEHAMKVIMFYSVVINVGSSSLGLQI